jgi:hypothetical protein
VGAAGERKIDADIDRQRSGGRLHGYPAISGAERKYCLRESILLTYGDVIPRCSDKPLS